MPLLIAVEGIDGSGTTTQVARLSEWMHRSGHAAVTTREPTQGLVGEVLWRIIRQRADTDPRTVALLFAADRLDHICREIQPALAAGKHVVTDRYLLSSLVYQSVDCDPDWVVALNRFARPADLNFLIDIPAEVAAARRRADARESERFDAPAFQRRLVDGYRGWATKVAATVIDGQKSVAQIHHEIVTHLEKRLLAGS